MEQACWEQVSHNCAAHHEGATMQVQLIFAVASTEVMLMLQTVELGSAGSYTSHSAGGMGAVHATKLSAPLSAPWWHLATCQCLLQHAPHPPSHPPRPAAHQNQRNQHKGYPQWFPQVHQSRLLPDRTSEITQP